MAAARREALSPRGRRVMGRYAEMGWGNPGERGTLNVTVLFLSDGEPVQRGCRAVLLPPTDFTAHKGN